MSYSRIYYLPAPVLKMLAGIRKRFSNSFSSSDAPEFLNEYNKHRPAGRFHDICYAPQKSLYFGADGNVVACCLNRTHILGTIPENSVREIWQSDAIKNLRVAIASNDFSKGCYQCQHRIESGNYDAVEARLYDILPRKKRYPTQLEFELSNACNLKCIMCSGEFSNQWTDETKTLKNYGPEFLEQLREFIPHLFQAKFLGGEPFLIPIYYDIWELIFELNPHCRILVQTNGSILNDRIKSLITKGQFQISLSIDSFRKETFEAIRSGASFEMVKENLEYFREYAHSKKIPFSISVCPMQQNQDEISEIISECNRQDMLVYFNTVWYPPQCSLYSLSSAELATLVSEYAAFQPSQVTYIQKRNKTHYEHFINQLRQWEKMKEISEAERSRRHQEYKKWKSELESISVGQMAERVMEKIAQFPEISKINETEISRMRDKLMRIAGHFETDNYVKMALGKLAEYPAELILQELAHTEEGRLVELAGQMIAECKSQEIS
ncbi:MAG: twitch domain-containing radical SAM protein [Bacteroidota bacterium]